MAADPDELTPWLAIDAGGTRLRVARVALSPLRIEGPVWSAPFPEGDRAEFARGALVSQAVEGPFRLALAWAGAPTPDGEGIAWARFGSPLPRLTEQLCRDLPVVNRPQVHSDARAALAGACALLGLSDAYGLVAGTGLGEAWCSRGTVWPREEFLQRLGRAADLAWEGIDAESALRGSAWHDNPAGRLRAERVLQQLIAQRLARVERAPQAVLLGGRLAAWRADELPPTAGGVPFRAMPQDCALPGAVTLECDRLGLPRL